MIRTYNIGTECYALITCVSEPEFILPVKIILLEKFINNNNATYKVKIKEIFESDLNFLKEHFSSIKVVTNIKSDNRVALLKKGELEKIDSISELIQKLNKKPFYLDDNYITIDKEGLLDLYNKFVKYIINYHFRKLYMLTSRSFLVNQPIYGNQKDIFKRRIEKIGFGDMFEKYNLKLDI